MVYPTLAILLVVAALCFGLGRFAPARLLGLAAGAASLAAAALVAFSPLPAPETAPVDLLALGGVSFSISPGLSGGERAIAVGLLGGAGAALLALAGAIARAVRGFGAIFAWALLALAAALLSLAAPPLSLAQPLAWAVVAIGGYGSLRASGATGSEAPPLGLTFGLVASTLLAGGILAAGGQIAAGELPAWPAAICGLTAALAMAGSPPAAFSRSDASDAPAPLGALVYGLAAPATALGWLLRVTPALPSLPSSWMIALGLIGGLGALACGAGALGERQLRAILTWATAGQTALVVAATGLTGQLAGIAGQGLLLSLMLASALGSVAAATLERTTGSDDYTAGGARPPRMTGLVWAAAAVASLGLPPLWGFWPRLWLLIEAQRQQPWLLAPLLAGAVLTSLAMLAPLAKLFAPGAAAGRARAGWGDSIPAALVGLPLLVLGVAPGLAWGPWLQAIASAPAELPASPSVRIAALSAGAALVALAIMIGLAAPARTLVRDPDEEPVRLAPEALGSTLLPLAWLGNPMPLMRWLWAGLQLTSQALRFLMGLFEQRYYLLGMLAVLIMIMLLMAQ